MKKAKGLSRKLMALLLSAAMIAASALPSIPAYAAEAEAGIESTGDLLESLEPDDTDSANTESDENASVDEGAGESDSENEETNESSPDSEGNGESGSENESAGDDGSENEGANEEGLGDEDEETIVEGEEPVASVEGEEDIASQSIQRTATQRGTRDVSVSGFKSVGGWNESIYAEISGVSATDVVEVSYSGAMSGSLGENKVHGSETETDLDYLVRDIESDGGSCVRIDIPGLKAGTYTLKVVLGSNNIELTKSNIEVYAYDRSGYAHFNYTEGVGAYNDDGTLKDKAIVLYVTDDNKNDVELTVGSTTLKGIGNILNTAGQSTNYIKKLAEAGTPLVVRFIGTVSESGLYEQGTYDASDEGRINGLTDYNSTDNGGSVDDNGHMARIKSGKDITLEGIGFDATIDGWGFHYIAENSTTEQGMGKSFEVRNLTFINTPEDAIGMEGQQDDGKGVITAGVERCWIHNNSFYRPDIGNPAEPDKAQGDGSVDFKRGQYFTCSYNYFDSCHKTNLVGASDTNLQYNLSYHHNYWYMCESRGPLSRQANIHMYNNIFDMQTNYAMNTRANAYIFSEYNLFYACKNPQVVESGAIKSWNDSISSQVWSDNSDNSDDNANTLSVTVVTSRDQCVENSCSYNGTNYSSFDINSDLFYYDSYDLQEDFTELRKVIASQTGTQAQNPERPEKVAKSEYSVIDRTEADVVSFDDLSQEVSVNPGKISKTCYAFEVPNTAFDLGVEYTGSVDGVLVNEAGENLLEGTGSIDALPAGKYMIQALTFTTANSATGELAVFKDFTIASLKLSANKHTHNWVLDSTVEATCTESGKNVYKCTAADKCPDNNIKVETIPALGHSWKWVVDKKATESETGLKHQECTICGEKQNENTIIPQGVIGDYVLYFTEGKPNGDTTFFKLNNESYETEKGPVNVNGDDYTDCLKIDTDTEISFNCSDMVNLYLVFDTADIDVKIDGTTYKTGVDGSIEVSNLNSGDHTISKDGTTDTLLFYVAVSIEKSDDTSDSLSIKYDVGEGSLPNGTQKTISAKAGEMLTLPVCTPPEGKQFLGWKVDNSDTIIKDSYTVSANDVGSDGIITLTAVYGDDDADDEYVTVTLNLDGGTLVDGDSTEIEIKANETIDLGGCKKDGYRFLGWSIDGENIVEMPYIVMSNITLTALYEEGNEYEGIHIIGLEKSYEYTGAKIIPNIGVIDYNIGDNGRLLAPGVDYTVKYKNNAKVGDNTASVLITGKGNYTGKNIEQKFSIVEVTSAEVDLEDLKGAKLDKINPEPYTGDSYYPDITLTLKGKSAVKYTYDSSDNKYKAADGTEIPANVAVSNNINKGTATILLTGKNGSNGKPTTIKKTFKITAIDLAANKSKVEVTPEAGTYAVKGAAPKSITVTYDGKTLKNGTDYTVKYSSNKKAGAKVAKITITGKGNYAKKITDTYSIDKLDLEDIEVKAVKAYTGIKAGKVTATVVDKEGNALKSSQYMLHIYSDEAGTSELNSSDILSDTTKTIYVQAVAKDEINLVKDSKTPIKAFAVGTNIASAKFTLKKVDGKTLTKTYTGAEIELGPDDIAQATIKVSGTSKNLVRGEDYDVVSYSNNINKGTATAVIIGKNNYSGIKTIKFKIVGQEIEFEDEKIDWSDIQNTIKGFMEGLFN